MPTRSPSPRAPAPYRATAPSFRAGRRAAARVRADRVSVACAIASVACLLVAVVGAGALGCHRNEAPLAPPPPAWPKPSLGGVVVRIVTPPDDEKTPQLDAAPLQRMLFDHLLGTGLFASTGPVARLDARVATEVVEVSAAGEARARVELRLDDGQPDAPDSLSFKLEGRGSERYAIPKGGARKGAVPPPPDRAAILSRLVVRIADDLIDGYVARRQLDHGPPAIVHAALEADGGELRDEAIRVVGERKLRDEAPILLKLLNDPQEPTRDAALGALIALGDRRAVAELTRTRSLRDRREMRKIIEAIAILGGQEANEYLSFVAATHDDDEIRAAAAAAHARLERRENDAVAPGSM